MRTAGEYSLVVNFGNEFFDIQELQRSTRSARAALSRTLNDLHDPRKIIPQSAAGLAGKVLSNQLGAYNYWFRGSFFNLLYRISKDLVAVNLIELLEPTTSKEDDLDPDPSGPGSSCIRVEIDLPDEGVRTFAMHCDPYFEKVTGTLRLLLLANDQTDSTVRPGFGLALTVPERRVLDYVEPEWSVSLDFRTGSSADPRQDPVGGAIMDGASQLDWSSLDPSFADRLSLIATTALVGRGFWQRTKLGRNRFRSYDLAKGVFSVREVITRGSREHRIGWLPVGLQSSDLKTSTTNRPTVH